MPWYNFKAPSLPLPGLEYDQRREDSFADALRLYFNKLDASNYALSTNTGGGLLGFPHISASDTTDQYASADNTPTLVVWNTLESGNGFTLNIDGSATAEVTGIYKITFSLQFVNTDNAIHDAAVWLRVNGVDVPRSATSFSIPARKSAGNPSYICGYSEAVFQIDSTNEIELYWATDKAYSTTGPVDGVYMFADAAQTSPYARPAIPSAIGSITFVSAIPT